MLKGSYHRGTDSPWYQGRNLTDAERAAFRATTLASQEAKRRALRGECNRPKHSINDPKLDPLALMPQRRRNGLRTLSLFSGGGGMDVGLDRAGFRHVGNYEMMSEAPAVIRKAHPSWDVFDGADGDVTRVAWSKYRGKIDAMHGGPPCQPFSHAGRRNGAADVRDLIPELVRAVLEAQPRVFVCENVSGLATARFREYVQNAIYQPLSELYTIRAFGLDAADFGVPQKRKRVFFVGFRDATAAKAFTVPRPTHSHSHLMGEVGSAGLPRTMGAREALGLPDIGIDGLAPTIRSGFTGPRHTTSILNSVTALRMWNRLQIWPNGVARTRHDANMFLPKNGHFRLSVPDCLILQGFPPKWPIDSRAAYLALGLIGNSVAPPVSYQLA